MDADGLELGVHQAEEVVVADVGDLLHLLQREEIEVEHDLGGVDEGLCFHGELLAGKRLIRAVGRPLSERGLMLAVSVVTVQMS